MQPAINSHASWIFVQGEHWCHEKEFYFAILRETTILKGEQTSNNTSSKGFLLIFKGSLFLFPISCILNAFFCSSYSDPAICNATWSIPPTLLSYFLAGWAPWPVTEPSTVISFIRAPSAWLSNELRTIPNNLSWFHFNRLFFLNWDGQEQQLQSFRCHGWAADFRSNRWGVFPISFHFYGSFWHFGVQRAPYPCKRNNLASWRLLMRTTN